MRWIIGSEGGDAGVPLWWIDLSYRIFEKFFQFGRFFARISMAFSPLITTTDPSDSYSIKNHHHSNSKSSTFHTLLSHVDFSVKFCRFLFFSHFQLWRTKNETTFEANKKIVSINSNLKNVIVHRTRGMEWSWTFFYRWSQVESCSLNVLNGFFRLSAFRELVSATER